MSNPQPREKIKREHTFNTDRVKSLSDGVFAIAITILVLLIEIPEDIPEDKLADVLQKNWHLFFAYVTSFLLIGYYWWNHSLIFRMLDRIDRPIVAYNILFLLLISFIPFPTHLLMDYFLSEPGISVMLFACTNIAVVVVILGILRNVERKSFLLKHVDSLEMPRQLQKHFLVVIGFLIVGVIMSFINHFVSMTIFLFLPFFGYFVEGRIWKRIDHE